MSENISDLVTFPEHLVKEAEEFLSTHIQDKNDLVFLHCLITPVYELITRLDPNANGPFIDDVESGSSYLKPDCIAEEANKYAETKLPAIILQPMFCRFKQEDIDFISQKLANECVLSYEQ